MRSRWSHSGNMRKAAFLARAISEVGPFTRRWFLLPSRWEANHGKEVPLGLGLNFQLSAPLVKFHVSECFAWGKEYIAHLRVSVKYRLQNVESCSSYAENGSDILRLLQPPATGHLQAR